MTISPSDMARILDYTILGPEVSQSDLSAFIDSAIELGVGTICVPNSMVGLTLKAQDAGMRVATVAGFPHGKTPALVKAAEARLAVQSGASEVDVVLDIAVVKEGDSNRLLQEIVAIREAVPHPVVLKFILETAVVSDEAIGIAVNALIAAGADYAKTSTGFHPAGGATVEAIEVMAAAAKGRIGIKASGGVKTWEDAVALVAAGATRIGTSNAQAILEGAPA